MVVAERCWYFHPCRYAKSFSRLYARPSMAFKNNDYSWGRLTFTSRPLCEIVFKSTCGPSMILKHNGYTWEGWYFPRCRYAKPVSRVYVRPLMTSKNNAYSCERGWHLPQCRYTKSFSKVHAAPQWFSKAMIIAAQGWYFPPCRYAKSFSRVYARPSMTFRNNDYSWEWVIFSSMSLCEIVLKTKCEALNDTRKQFL